MYKQTRSRQGQAQEFEIWTLYLFLGLHLWTRDNSVLPTVPTTFTLTLKTFLW